MRMASSEHLLDRKYEKSAGPGLLQALQRLPKDVLAAYRVHGHFVRRPFERNDGRRLRARQKPADFRERRARGMQHDVFALLHLLHSINAHEELLYPFGLVR